MKRYSFKIKESTLEGVLPMNDPKKSNMRLTRIVTSVVVSFMLLTASVPMSTYAAIQAPPPRN